MSAHLKALANYHPLLILAALTVLSTVMRFFSFFPSVMDHDESTYLVIADALRNDGYVPVRPQVKHQSMNKKRLDFSPASFYIYYVQTKVCVPILFSATELYSS